MGYQRHAAQFITDDRMRHVLVSAVSTHSALA